MFDEKKLAQQLDTLLVSHRIAFAASCSERLLPNYNAFSQMESWGDWAFLRQALDEVWAFLAGQPLTQDRLCALMEQSAALAPHSYTFSSFFVGAAQEAVGAVYCTLDCCITGDAKQAALAGRLATDTLDSYLDRLNNPYTDTKEQIAEIKSSVFQKYPDVTELETVALVIEEMQALQQVFLEWVWQSPLMVAELEKQRRDLEALKSHQVLNVEFLEELRCSSSVMGIQPFRRGLVKNI